MLVHLCCRLKRRHIDLEVVHLEAGKACFRSNAATDKHHLARPSDVPEDHQFQEQFPSVLCPSASSDPTVWPLVSMIKISLFPFK